MTKICTDLQQSKRLVELGIDVNTADMCWCIRKLQWGEINKTIIAYPMLPNQEKSEDFKYIPAWSLTALLRIIKNCNLGYIMQTTYGNNVIIVCEMGEKPYTITTNEYDNEVDACVEMIVKLHEQNLL